MTIDIQILCRQLNPEETILLFGAGSSIPSGGLLGADLALEIAKNFNLNNAELLSLQEISTVVEKKYSRQELINFLRSIINPLNPSGSLLNIPLYPWKAIYTTNYDTLIEQAYRHKKKELTVYRSNFDFTLRESTVGTKLFKLHGSIEQDISDGHKSRMILSAEDYDLTDQYREQLFDNFRIQSSSSHMLIIGQSLSDPDLKLIIDEALRRKREAGGQGKIFLLLYSRDDNRALVYETRGIEICVGSLDDFFNEFVKKLPETQLAFSISDDPLDRTPALRPCTIDVAHAIKTQVKNATKMFNGAPASYADIASGLTFEREISNQIEAHFAQGEIQVAYILGASGVGKSTAAKQILYRLSQREFFCWQHNPDYPLSANQWITIEAELRKRKQQGVLLIDDCHSDMLEVNKLVESITGTSPSALKLLLVSSKHAWNPRQKALGIFSFGKGFDLRKLSNSEINSLIELLDREQDIKSLVENRFLGFSKAERIRRLQERCGADMFVCLKNIFAFDSIDHIILREYADLKEGYQDIYRTVSAMEAAGAKVHRQLVIRTLGINAEAISSILDNMTDIISEFPISEKDGLYAWRVRHSVIAEILTKYKYSDPDEAFSLFRKIIDNLNLTNNVEIRTLREMCDMKSGIGRVPDKNKQNELFRRMISIAPGERVPRHRLISNLIDQEEFEQAETEIRIFEKELRLDAPIHRYKIKLQLRKAEHTKGLMPEDRGTLIMEAANIAQQSVSRYPDDKNMYRGYCDVGLAYLRVTGKWDIYDAAIGQLKHLEDRIPDPDITRIIGRFESIVHRYKTSGNEQHVA